MSILSPLNRQLLVFAGYSTPEWEFWVIYADIILVLALLG